MLVSIIVPVHDAEIYLPVILAQLHRQTYSNCEFILVDDGSHDCSLKLLSDFAKSDSRAKVFHTDNRGVSAARNIGLEHAEGEYIAFVDSDDKVDEDFIEMFVNLAIANDADLVVSAIKRADANGSPLDALSPPQNSLGLYDGMYVSPLELDIPLYSFNHFIRADVNGGLRFPDGVRLFEDRLFLFSVYESSHRVLITNESKYCYIDNNNSAVHMQLTESDYLHHIAAERRYYERDASNGVFNKAYVSYVRAILSGATYAAYAKKRSVFGELVAELHALKTHADLLCWKERAKYELLDRHCGFAYFICRFWKRIKSFWKCATGFIPSKLTKSIELV